MTAPIAKASLLAAAAVAVLSLQGCAADQDELQQWMEQQRRDVKPSHRSAFPSEEIHSPGLRRAQQCRTFQFAEADGCVEAGSQAAELASGSGNQSSQRGARGFSDRQHVDGRERRARGSSVCPLACRQPSLSSEAGDYLGQNYGKITKISETDVTFREIVQDAAGEWIERMSALQLQEKAR
jgi:type IV pilus assembly protein PilP